MTTATALVPSEGICLDRHSNLFIVDIGSVWDDSPSSQRRAFVDVGAAVKFIAGREARLSAFLSPPGQSSDSAVYGVVGEVLESTVSETYMLNFANAPHLAIKLNPSQHAGEYEGFRRIYPAFANAD